MGLIADSCGTEEGAVQPFHLGAAVRADIIVCIGKDQEKELEVYGPALGGKVIVCWDDLPAQAYAQYCDPGLVSICKERIGALAKRYGHAA